MNDRALVQEQWNAVWRKADSSEHKMGFATALLVRWVHFRFRFAVCVAPSV